MKKEIKINYNDLTESSFNALLLEKTKETMALNLKELEDNFEYVAFMYGKLSVRVMLSRYNKYQINRRSCSREDLMDEREIKHNIVYDRMFYSKILRVSRKHKDGQVRDVFPEIYNKQKLKKNIKDF